MDSQLSIKDEAYLCLLCLKSSLERIIGLYWIYIQLRSIAGRLSPLPLAMVAVLGAKQAGLEKKLCQSWPDYMQNRRWHQPQEQIAQVRSLSPESQSELGRVCATELKMFQLVSMMIHGH